MTMQKIRAKNDDARWEARLLHDGLQCPICMEFFCQPVKLKCNHAFCRLCLMQSVRLAPDGRSCPECRACIDIDDILQHPVDEELTAAVRELVPADALEARASCEEARLIEFQRTKNDHLPVFFMQGMVSEVGQRIGLHIFEPRYKLLIRRAWQGNRHFLCASKTPEAGDNGVLVRLETAAALPTGNVHVEGRCLKVVRFNSVWVEEGTAGLFCADIGNSWHSGLVQEVDAAEQELRNLEGPIMPGSVSADAPPPSWSSSRCHRFLRVVMTQGTPACQRGDHEGCYRLYRRAAEELLSHVRNQPVIHAIVRQGLLDAYRAQQRQNFNLAVATLRQAFDDVLEEPLETMLIQDAMSVSVITRDQTISGSTAAELPVFYLSPGIGRGDIVNIQFFEPRYLVLAKEVSESMPKLFLYAGASPRPGMLASLVEIDSCEWDPWGRAIVSGKAIEKVRLGAVRVDSSKHGLVYARCPSILPPSTPPASTSGQVMIRRPRSGSGASQKQCCSIQ